MLCYNASIRACRAVLFDKLDTAKMHGLDTSNVSCRVVTWCDVTSQVEFGLFTVACNVVVTSIVCITWSCRMTNWWYLLWLSLLTFYAEKYLDSNNSRYCVHARWYRSPHNVVDCNQLQWRPYFGNSAAFHATHRPRDGRHFDYVSMRSCGNYSDVTTCCGDVANDAFISPANVSRRNERERGRVR